MTTTPHYIPGIDPDTGMVGAPGCSMIRYFKVSTVAERDAIADELDGDLCYVEADDSFHISRNGSWASAGGASVGTKATRPASAPAGTQFIATDVIATYYSTGSAWIRISTPAGISAKFDGTVAPVGYVLRDGTSYDRTNPLYEDLFAAIGYTHGGSGNNFNVADGRGRADVALNSADTEFDAVGEKTGAKTHVLTLAQMALHDHGPGNLRDGVPTEQGIAGSNNFCVVIRNWDNVTKSNFLLSSGRTEAVGGNGAHNNIQPSIAALGIVKL